VALEASPPRGPLAPQAPADAESVSGAQWYVHETIDGAEASLSVVALTARSLWLKIQYIRLHCCHLSHLYCRLLLLLVPARPLGVSSFASWSA
jgi:hypothetical protein